LKKAAKPLELLQKEAKYITGLMSIHGSSTIYTKEQKKKKQAP
jgi:hypothetical protein